MFCRYMFGQSHTVTVSCRSHVRPSQTAHGPRSHKFCHWGIRQSETQTSLLSHRDQLEDQNFTCSKLRYDLFQNANNKGADQSARMRRLVCAFVDRKPPKTGSRIEAQLYRRTTIGPQAKRLRMAFRLWADIDPMLHLAGKQVHPMPVHKQCVKVITITQDDLTSRRLPRS